MRWFGPDGEPPPLNVDDIARAPIPVGARCDWCQETIQETDFGTELPLMGDPSRDTVNYHDECWGRKVVGSVAHIEGKCSCFVKGAACTDPPGMTLREAAKAALALFRRRPN